MQIGFLTSSVFLILILNMLCLATLQKVIELIRNILRYDSSYFVNNTGIDQTERILLPR